MFFGIDLIQAIQVIGYPGIFAIILAESGLFFAVYLPGGSLLFTAGLLASQDILNIWILLSIVIIAATLGDTIGYWFGAWVGPALWRREDSRFLKRTHLEQTRAFFDEHGAKTILLARFVPIVRTFAPILAGVGEMRYHTFLFYNVLGAIIWGGGFTLAGYFLGTSIPDASKYLEIIVLGIVFVTVLPLVHHMWQARRRKKRYTERMHEGVMLSDSRIEKINPKAVIFDLDDTLAESFQPPSDAILEKLFTLAERMPVAVMTGATFARVERDVMSRLPAHRKATFLVFSDNGARSDLWKNGVWEKQYGLPLEDTERSFLAEKIEETVQESGIYTESEKTHSILDRGTSVSFVALPRHASKAEKDAWDPHMTKKNSLVALLRPKIPGFDVLIAGRTTIDVVRKGISKAYGVEWLSAHLGIPAKDMLFVGDAFFEGGNDAAVIPTGVRTHHTSGPEETEKLIDSLLDA